MKPHSILITTILLLALFCSGSLNAQNLILWHSDGTTTEVDLLNRPLVKFVKDKVLVVTSTIINLEYDKNDVLRFTYSGSMEDGINSPVAEANMEQKDGRIIIHDVKTVDKVAVYKTNGIRVPVHFSFQGNDVVLSLSQIPSGIYLFSVNGRTSKFTKK